jgi:hypothetical protein
LVLTLKFFSFVIFFKKKFGLPFLLSAFLLVSQPEIRHPPPSASLLVSQEAVDDSTRPSIFSSLWSKET